MRCSLARRLAIQTPARTLVREHGDAIPVMRAIKAALDPLDIMNPDKIFDLLER